MDEFSIVEDTLFVPMLGRIYASEEFPHILVDEKALELKEKLPQNIKGQDTQTQYTFMASAVRSTNMDRYVQAFLKEHEDGIIVELGCGLETTYFRNKDTQHPWYEVDLDAVINYRRELLGEPENVTLIAADGFSDVWIRQIRAEHPDSPILVTASGLFYYFEKATVVGLFETLKNYGPIEVVFDTVNGAGMKRMAKYMKQVGHEDASMYFYVDDIHELEQEIGVTCLKEEPYYAHTDKKCMKFITKASMVISDKCMMVKMEHLKLA